MGTKRTPQTRRPIDEALAPATAAVLIYGWRGDLERLLRREYRGDADPLDPYLKSWDELEELWHRHRAFIEREAKRLGLVQPWAAAFFGGPDDPRV